MSSLDAYWQLASPQPAERKAATKALLESVRKDRSDVPYVLKRLVRGLGSSRSAARQGFSLALTEILSQCEWIDTSELTALSNKFISTSNTANRQEKRDYYFGTIFMALTLVRSGRLATIADKELTQMVETLCKISRNKRLIREVCFSTLGSICTALPFERMEEHVLPAVLSLYRTEEAGGNVQEQSLSALSPEHVALGLVLQNLTQDHADDVGMPKNIKRLMQPKHYGKLLTSLAQSTHAHPRTHSVWEGVLERLLAPLVAGPATVEAEDNFAKFWSEVVDMGLFAAKQPAQKDLAFRVTDKALAALAGLNENDNEDGMADDIDEEEEAAVDAALVSRLLPVILGRNMLRCFINNVGLRDRTLHKTALQTQALLVRVAKSSPTLGLSIVHQLTGKHGARNFDRRTKSNTVASILATLDGEAVQEYIAYLIERFNSPPAHAEEGDEEDDDEEEKPSKKKSRKGKKGKKAASEEVPKAARPTNPAERARLWAVEHLYKLSRKSQLPGPSDGSVGLWTVLKFFLFHGFFDSSAAAAGTPKKSKAKKSKRKGKSKRSKAEESPTVDLGEFPASVEGDIGEQVRALCASRFSTLMGELLPKKAAATGASSSSSDKDGASWALQAHQLWAELSAHKYTLVQPLGPDDEEARETMLVQAKALQSAVAEEANSKGADKDSARLAQLKALQQLMLQVGLLQLTEAEEATPLLEEIAVCYGKAIGADDDDDSDDDSQEETEDTYVEVLVDILLSLLVKPSLLLRDLSKQVFSAFSPQLTQSALSDLLTVLSSRKKAEDDADSAAMDDDDDDDDDGEEEDSDDEFQAITPEEAAAAAARLSGLQDGLVAALNANVPVGAGARRPAMSDDSDSEAEEEEVVDLDALGELLMSEPDQRELVKMGMKEEELRLMQQDDARLAHIVQLRRAKREDAKALARETLHFKLRVVDLVEVFLKKQGSSPLVLGCVEPLVDALGGHGGRVAENKPLHDRVMAVYKKRLCKSRDVPRVAVPAAAKKSKKKKGKKGKKAEEEDEEEEKEEANCVQLVDVREMMERLMARAAKTKQRDTLSLLSHALLYLTRVSCPSFATNAAAQAEGARGKQEEEQAEWVVAQYSAALAQYVGSKVCCLNNIFFSGFVKAFPRLGLRLVPGLMQMARASDSDESESSKKKRRKKSKAVVPASAFLRTECFALAEVALREKAACVQEGSGSVVVRGAQEAGKALLHALAMGVEATEEDNASKSAVKGCKAALRCAAAACTACKRAEGEEGESVATVCGLEAKKAVEGLPDALAAPLKAAVKTLSRVAGWTKSTTTKAEKRKRAEAKQQRRAEAAAEKVIKEEEAAAERAGKKKRHRGNRGGKKGQGKADKRRIAAGKEEARAKRKAAAIERRAAAEAGAGGESVGASDSKGGKAEREQTQEPAAKKQKTKKAKKSKKSSE